MLSNRSMPEATVIPVLVYPDFTRAVDWLCDTFGFSLRLRIADHRAQLNVADGAVVVTSGSLGDRQGFGSIMVRVKDVNFHYERSKERQARVLIMPADYSYGERQYTVEDLAGHHWTFSQSILDIDPSAWGGSLK